MTVCDNTVVLVTGTSRGIGRTLVETFLLRPKHTVIASVRDTAADYVKELEALSKADGSRLQLVKIESSNSGDPAAAIKDLTDIDHIDVVVANAGGAGEKGVIPLDVVSPEIMTDVFTVNALGPLALYQAVKPLLEKSHAPNAIHSANKDFIAFAVHPGLVQTESGNKSARAMGLPQAPDSQRRSVDSILGLIDNATRETTSGKFFNVIDGTEIPW
ncbi:Short-chain dehydrogenase/reductase SDR [Penicillium hordei]|uniref:Short-chain dehydrogenase/reductase SDR n=1 Tax=Penicillium hordei TaxID=40994 RepID=A0AAD6GSZ4_9EURO|nr:Short-chain dehydrogenase/reductase SDR [Penicillium hordei]KAJ5588092.1 Short-chain dehydrogenase/reductase SDR [Penicillium hordei]